MGGSSKSQTVGYRYYMGLHFGLCHGPADEIQAVSVGDREAWVGQLAGSGSISISKPELFGGDKKEGGVVGGLDVMMGGPAQGASAYLASKLGATLPAFRGIVSAVWQGGQVSANNPYIKPWSFRVKRILQGWSGGTAWYPQKASIFGCAKSSTTALYIAIDGSGSMATITGNGQTRFANLQTAVRGVLDYIGEFSSASLVRFDIMIVVWGGMPDGSDVMFRGAFLQREVDWEKITALKSWVSGLTPGLGTYFPAAVADAADFFAGSPAGADRTVVFITDGEPSAYVNGAWQVGEVANQAATNAASTLFSIPYVKSFGFNIDLTNTEQTAKLDNTAIDGVPVVSGGDPTALRDALVVAFGLQDNMNPAHIIYQCLTDTVWGMGYPVSALDDASFTAAADALYGEAFGISLLWNKQDTLESFIRTVLDHVGAILYVRPDTGKFALKLVRDDYVRESLPIYGPSNLLGASDYQRQAWGETINEVTVVYVDGLTNKEASITVQDLANIQTQGGVVSQVKQYPGIRCPGLAQRVALRDLSTASTPLSRIKLTANRAAWEEIPGGVIRLNWPEYEIADVVFRILEVNRGTLQNGEIIIEAVEDVFAMPGNTYVATQDGIWIDPSSDPAPAPYRKLIEAPYWSLVRGLSSADLAYIDPLSGYLETVAVRPSGDALNYEINSKVGAGDYFERATGEFCPSAILVADIAKAATSISFTAPVDVDMVTTGGYAIIGDEYVLIVALDVGAGTASIARGLLDTVPAVHFSGTRIWFADGYQGIDQTEYAEGEYVDVKLLPRTGLGELAINSAPFDSIAMGQRHYRPYPPGKMAINSLTYPVEIGSLDEVALTWAHRDRLLQTAYLVTQDEGNIGPEPGATYRLRFYGEAQTLLRELLLSGTAYTYAAADEKNDSQLPASSGDIHFASVTALLHMSGVDGATTFPDTVGNTWVAQGGAAVSSEQARFGGTSAKCSLTAFDEYFSAQVVLHLPLTGVNNGTAFPYTNIEKARTITPYGDVKTVTSQFKWDGSSAYFDGTGDYLEIATSADFDYAADDFTIEFWIRPGSNKLAWLYSRTPDGTPNTYRIDWTDTGVIRVLGSSNNSTWTFSNYETPSLALNTWHHFALVRSGASLFMYLNGTRARSDTALSLVATTQPVRIGGHWTSGDRNFLGHLQDYRISKGLARYTGATYTVPTRSFPHPGNMPALDYAGGAGTGLGTADFTVEAWVRPLGLDVASVLFDVRLASSGAGATGNFYYAKTTGYLVSSADGVVIGNEGSGVAIGAWSHVAFVRSSGQLSAYLNGVLQWSAAFTNDLGASRPARIGASRFNGVGVNGYLDEVRVTKGVARYTANFTPPIEPFADSLGGLRLNSQLRIELESIRGGLTSYQRHNHEVYRTESRLLESGEARITEANDVRILE